MLRNIVYSAAFSIAFGALAADEPAPVVKPQWQRMLEGDDAKKAADLKERIDAAEQADHYDESVRLHEELLALRTSAQGADHWETVNEKWELDGGRKLAALPAEKRAAWRKAFSGTIRARQLVAQEKHADALPLFQNALALDRELFGKKHPYTARGYAELADSLAALRRYAEALPLFQQALDLRRELLGDNHPDTAQSANDMAGIVLRQGKYAEAQALLEQALEVRRTLLGERNRETATSMNNLAFSLNAQQKYADAQPLYERSLALRRELLGEQNRDTAMSFNSLALNLHAQGKYADAQALYEKALGLCREMLGETHPDNIALYSNLARNLSDQGKYAQAQSLYQAALQIGRRHVDEQHPNLVPIYTNLALNLDRQGKYAEAQAQYQVALDACRARLGENHDSTATSYSGLANNLDHQGKHADALPLHRTALDIFLRLHGESHSAMNCRNNLADSLNLQRKYAEAEPLLRKVLDAYVRGLGEKHPDTAIGYSNLAANLAAQGKYAEALPRLHHALNRGRELLGEAHPEMAGRYANLAYCLAAQGDDAGALAALTQATASYEAARLSVAGRALDRALFGAERSPYRLLAAIHARCAAPQPAWAAAESDLARGLSDEAASRRGVTLSAEERRLQNNLVERLNQLRPLIARLVVNQAPTDAERDELAQLQDERRTLEDQLAKLAVTLSRRERATFAEVQAALPSDAALVLWVDDLDRSGKLQEHWGCVVRPIGDPIWIRLPGTGNDNQWTDDDLSTSRNLSTALAGKATEQDIDALRNKLYLQRISPLEKHLDGVARLFVVPVNLMSSVPVEVLTDRFTVSYVPSGTLLAQLHDRPRPTASTLLALGDPVFPPADTSSELPDGLPLAYRGGEWAELPGSAIEVAALETLMGSERTTALTRSAASEQGLEQLRASGKLAEFRYLHFATHGEPNNARSFESALILAQDQVSTDVPLGGEKYYDGRLTANEVLDTWQLNADLVTLSACESAAGRPGGGDGALGFAQAFLLAGSRAVCLSLWKVDDTATALLMDRFYQNMLGKRPELNEPLPKAAALAEAKRWLRDLNGDDVARLAERLSRGVARGKGEPALRLAVPDAESPAAELRPFSHPRYWAAFILIGDPD